MCAPFTISEDVARNLAVALMRCQNFLPLFIEEGWKLNRAIETNDEAHVALAAYCAATGTTPARLWSSIAPLRAKP